MDAIDRKILGVLQDDASLSVAEIGNRVGLSSTPCWKRIQKLEAEGVIQKRVAVVDPDKVGSRRLGVRRDRNRRPFGGVAGQVRASRSSAMPEVMEFYRMAGDVDYMLRVVGLEHPGLRRVLQEADRSDPAEERDLALCDGADQADDGAADTARRSSFGELRSRIRKSLPRT